MSDHHLKQIWTRSAGWIALALGLAACSAAQVPMDEVTAAKAPGEIVADCCSGAGDYPDWAIELADANVELMRQVGLIQLRRGYMGQIPEAVSLVKASLEPLDIVFLHNRNRMSGQLIPGQFTHGAIYMGTEAQLRAAGLWHLKALDPWREQIARGDIYMEAVDGGVRLAPAEVVLNTDAVVMLRPQGMSRAAILNRGMERMGVPFDMRFDAGDHSKLFCAELIGEMYPAAHLPHSPVPALNRETILIDKIVAGVLSLNLPFRLVGYVKADAKGSARALSAQALAWDIHQAWPAPPR
ncbi:MAG: YiiX/YebB-like N1pC/P60 family cysteine hydrolase [Maritimibacter sp.]